MSTATPAGVRSVIASDLDDDVLDSFIDDAEFRSGRVNDHASMGSEHLTQLIRYYAALLVRSFRDRALDSGSRRSVKLSYDGSALDELRQQVRDLDPSGELASQPGVTRRQATHVGSARPHSRDGIGDP